MAEEHQMVVREVAMPSIANVTSSIVKPRVTGHFELKQSMIQLLHVNRQFIGLPHEDPQQHILNFLEISDTYITNGVTPNYVRLTLFPFSLLGEAKRWLKAEPANSITSWNDLGHTSDLCPANPESVCFVGNANRGQTNQYGNTYNSNRRNHPNFSWSGNQGTQNQYRPQEPQQQYRPPQDEQQASPTSHLEDMLKKVMAEQQSLAQKFMAEQQAQAATMRNLEHQMGQLASAQNTRPVGALPSDTEANPKASLNVVSLRNRRQLEEVQSKKRKQVNFDERPDTIESTSEKSKESEKPAGEAVVEIPPPLVARTPPPFPKRLQNVQINIPLVDILQEVPKYSKYIKDIVKNKRRLIEFETVALIEECSSRIKGNLPQKLKDLGVIENVLVQVVSFIFPADFIILDYEPDQEVPFILGRPFLAMGRAIIDVCEGKMTMRVGDRVEVFNVYKALKLPAHYEELSMISVVESDATSLVPYMSPVDPLERALIGDEEDSKDEMTGEIEQVLDMPCNYVHGFGKFEELDRQVTLTPPKPSIEEAPKLELKPLPAHLRYAYLGNSETFLVIISSSLTNTKRKIAQSTPRA
ncbi:PREDICTED: uncharacterized protein LOC109238476 [Nicotiana attenuata]|uniref:uncharacterized protein LOC109238476 n=1 Tax=Nicotiana attenuata TaxID=49451 RepID=UPI000904F8A3|nr:PREDICTED: uncharacterized protein LOC109238476 [Nicotiana attenuata]